MLSTQRAASFVFLAAGALTMVACGSSSVRGSGEGEPELELQLTQDVATGSDTAGFLRHDCPSGTVRCNKPAGEPVIETATASDPSVIEVVPQGSRLAVRALRDGVSTVIIRAASADGTEKKELTGTVRVATPDRVTLEPPNRCDKPVRLGVGAKFKIGAQLWRGPMRLNGAPYPFPVKSDVAKATPEGASFHQLEMEAQDKPGVGSIQSTFDPTDQLPVEIFEANQVTKIVLTPSSTTEQLGGHPLVKKGASIVVNAVLSVATEDGKSTAPLCEEKLPLDVTSDHPEVCTGQRLNNGSGVLVQTKAGGTCTLTVKVGATATATQTFEVREEARGF